MMDERDDPILDACLEEVLGGRTPPDMTDRILRALQPPVSNPPDRSLLPVPVTSTPFPSAARGRSARTRSSFHIYTTWLAAAATIAMVVVGVTCAWLARPSHAPPVPVTHKAPSPTADDPPAPTPRQAPAPLENALAQDPPETKAPPVSFEPSPRNAVLPAPPREAPQPADAVELAAMPSIPDVRPEPLPQQQIVQRINELVRAQWRAQELSAAKPVNDADWYFRVHERLLGSVPPAGAAEHFAANKSRTKREELLDTLLHDADFVEEFAEHWGDVWTDLLIGFNARQGDQEVLDQYLRRSLADGKPFDTVVWELLTASGSLQPGTSDFNGAAIYLASHADRNRKQIEATGHVARVFLGVSLSCVQCHNHPWHDFRQQQFWNLNAFFRQMQVNSQPDGSRLLQNVDFAGEGSTPEQAEVFYELPSGLLKSAFPVFVDGTEIPESGNLRDIDRRQVLAQFVIRSDYFREAMVNRFWGELFGVGFTQPVDDMRPVNSTSNPELLSFLAGQFAAHDFDVRSLLRWLALSEAFGLSSPGESHGELTAADVHFAQFPALRRMTKPTGDMLQIAAEFYAQSVSGNPGVPARIVDPNAPATEPELRADMVRLLTAAPDNIAARNNTTAYGSLFLASSMPAALKIQHMFWATVHREPTRRELDAIEKMLTGADDRATDEALQYVWWALTNNADTGL